MGLIVRTAGANKTKNDIGNDLDSLIKNWEKIKESAINSLAPSLIHRESEIIKRTLRDIYDEQTISIIVEGNEGYQKAKNFMKILMPQHVKKIKKYREKIPLFIKENIETKLNDIFETEVKLLSGGYLVINPTEALVSIDVNSGKSIKQKNVESTALDTNLEAADEIARQIKIRDLSGLIIIDFIDMLSFNNRRQVEKKLKDRCRTDRARIQIGRISNFGLLEMSRQRLRESSVKWEINLTNDSFAFKILKLIEEKAVIHKGKFIDVYLNEKTINFINEHLSKSFDYIQKKLKIKIELKKNDLLIIPEYTMDIKNKSKKIIEKIEKLNFYKENNEKNKLFKKNKIIKKTKRIFSKKKKYFKRKN